MGSNPGYLLKSFLLYLEMVLYIYLNFCVLIFFSRLRRHQNFASCRNIPICQYQHGIFDFDEKSVEVSYGYGCTEHSKWPKKLGTFGRFVGQNPESPWRVLGARTCQFSPVLLCWWRRSSWDHWQHQKYTKVFMCTWSFFRKKKSYKFQIPILRRPQKCEKNLPLCFDFTK